MTEIHVHNPGPSVLVYTSEGHLMAPQRTKATSDHDPVTARLIDSGRLLHLGSVEATQPEEPVVPAGNAATQEWVDYAIAMGLPEDDVSEMRRDDIRALFDEEENETTPSGGEEPEDQSTAPGGADDESEEES